MAGRHWEDWFEREEFIGHISDIRVQNLQVERQVVQKRTFTRWMNLHLKKCDPPLQIQDLFQDIQDGYVLMALLEELSGSKLLHGFKKSTHRIFRLNNIAKVLSFLEERNVKLVSIDAVDITDGNSSIILGLIWNIILFFQIKELTGNIRSQFPSSSSLSSIPTSSDSDTSFSSTPSEERQSVATTMKENSKAIKKLLQWIQRRTRKYGVAVQDFGKSWTSGLAFLAVIKSIDSSLVDMSKALLRTPRENLQDAFRIAHYSLGIPRLLEPEDVTINVPDEQSIIIYVSQFLEHFPGIQESEVPSQTIERSVSMSRLSFREIDSEHMRNGAHRSRVKQCSFMFQKDSTQPPPKQLISSVSEDRSVLEPRFRVAAARSWSSEDILSDPPHTEDAPNSVDVNPKDPSSDLLQEFGSSQQLFTQSPSSVPESLIGDSAINSPDSWMEGELNPDRYCESHSDSSLCDSGMAWDVYRATPVEVTPYDEGFISSVEDRAPEESIIETYIDDGMSSQDTIDMQTVRNPEEKPENESLNQDEGPDSVGDFRENKNITHLDEIPFHQDTVTGEKEPLDNMCEAEELDSPAAGDPQKLDQLNQFEPIFSTEPPEEIPMKKQDGEGSYQDGKHTSPTESQERRSEMETEDHRTDLDLQDEEVEFNEGNDSAVECLDILRDFTQCKKTNSSESSPKPSLNIPLISITSEPEELDKETEPYTVILDCDEFEDEERNTETQASEGPDPLSSVSSKDDEPGNTPGEQGGTHLEGNYDNKEKKDVSPESDSQRDGDVSAQCPSENILNQPENPDEDSRTLAVGHLDKPTERDTDNSPQNLLDSFDCFQSILDAGSLKLNGQIGTLRSQPEDFPRNQFSSDFGRSSPAEDLVGDRVEPMDLFYPDKEESLLPEPPEIDVRWPLVLSVSALQPAPTSDRPEDLNVDFLSEEFTTGGEQDQITSLTNQTPSDPPPSQEQCVMCGVTIGAPQDSDDSETDNKGSSLRIDSVRSDDIHIPPVLRHRKGGRLSDSKEKPRGAPITAEPEDSDLWWRENWELCLLLLLWLLLYSFMVLPQLDLKMLPSLLLNQ